VIRVAVRSWILAIPALLLAASALGQERAYLEDDPREEAARYLSHIQQVAGMQTSVMPVTKSREEAVKVAREVAILGANGRLGQAESDERTRLIERLQAELLSQYDKTVARMPTRYSDWYTLWLIGERAKEIEQAASDLGHAAALPRALVGDVPTVCVNALAVPVPRSSQRLVLVQSGMVNSMWHAMNLFVASIGIDTGGGPDASLLVVRDRIGRRAIALHFGNALGAAAGQIPEPVMQVTPELIDLVGDLHRGAVLFVLAHEYAHVILKHTESKTRNFSLMMARQPGAPASFLVEVEAAAKSREQEFAADKLGLELLVRAARATPYTADRVDTVSWAPEAYFAWLELFEASVSQFTGEAAPDYSRLDHPSPGERLREVSGHRARLGLKSFGISGFREAWRQRLSQMNNGTFRAIYGPFLRESRLVECH
jgi:Zn-dependent protease with chaperone function